MVQIVVIGHYPGYLDLAEEIGATFFAVPPSTWNSLSEDERWAANRTFLDHQIGESAVFVLSTAPDRVRRGSYFESELRYLISAGYVARRGATHWELTR